jgi:hypothetical protein
VQPAAAGARLFERTARASIASLGKNRRRHVCSLFEKLDVQSRTEALAAVYERLISH